MQKEVENWWKQANSDLKSAQYLMKDRRYNDASFFAQQAVEKALKTLLLKKDFKLIKTHDLVLLSRKLDLPEEFLTLSKKLTPVYVETRYPGVEGWRKFSKEESEEDIKTAKRIMEWIKKEL